MTRATPPNSAPPIRPKDVFFGLAFFGGVALFVWTIVRALFNAG